MSYYESFDLAMRPKTLAALEPVIRELAEGCWEDDSMQTELLDFANDIASRLQRIAEGDLQR